MLVFDIPYSAPNGTWHIETPEGQSHAFDARHRAVEFAARQAARAAGVAGAAYLSIEGADGKWRLFGPDLKAPVPKDVAQTDGAGNPAKRSIRAITRE